MTENLIAPGGMNCSLCLGYQREKNKCPGCKKIDAYKTSCRRKCVIRSCQIFKKKKMKFCPDKCEKYQCKRLKGLDKRYRTKYGMSILKNLENIKEKGVEKFIENQKKIWKRGNCGELLCVDRNFCLKCGKKSLKI